MLLANMFGVLAQSGAPAGGAMGGGLGSFLIFIPLFGILYFLMIRPQQKKQKEQQEMLKKLKAGDRVRTVGGILGTIKQVTEGTVKLEIADGVVVEFLRGAVDKMVDAPAADEKSSKESAKETKESK